ncbi:hypothetical protein ASE73_15585 [Sphingomonas sp. Leaf24]|uniref:acyltransferase family protein n=1 Tax=unclassified Sphingomonas TaxID=196159 RepID=UPI0006FECD3A|nr:MULTISPECIES: acyltransferase [unclassified Sphingomonas]KQM21470.1 hypothetical protein ASE50_13815 [Sphingomonas sp. Leaf5]KQM93586.1 hypothetical protein ASE73_15585 [Sphingomonas sp. Leaf24]
MVVIHHVGLLPAGHVGVTFFFVLSGFILAYNYDGRIKSGKDAFAFLRRRFSRIYPTHLLTVILAMPLAVVPMAGSASQAWDGLAANVLLIQSWFVAPSIYFSMNAVSWSISDEQFFYALCPILIVGLSKIGVKLSLVLVLFWTMSIVILAASWDEAALPVTSHWMFYIKPLVRLVEFVVGMALGRSYVQGIRARSGTIFEILTISFAISSILLINYVNIPEQFSLSLAFLPAAIALVWVFAHEAGKISEWISHPLALLMGEASFMLYMIHQLVMRYATGIFGSYGIVALIAGGVSVLLSVPLYMAFERPVQRWLNRRGRPVATQAAGTT